MAASPSHTTSRLDRRVPNRFKNGLRLLNHRQVCNPPNNLFNCQQNHFSLPVKIDRLASDRYQTDITAAGTGCASQDVPLVGLLQSKSRCHQIKGSCITLRGLRVNRAQYDNDKQIPPKSALVPCDSKIPRHSIVIHQHHSNEKINNRTQGLRRRRKAIQVERVLTPVTPLPPASL